MTSGVKVGLTATAVCMCAGEIWRLRTRQWHATCLILSSNSLIFYKHVAKEPILWINIWAHQQSTVFDPCLVIWVWFVLQLQHPTAVDKWDRSPRPRWERWNRPTCGCRVWWWGPDVVPGRKRWSLLGQVSWCVFLFLWAFGKWHEIPILFCKRKVERSQYGPVWRWKALFPTLFPTFKECIYHHPLLDIMFIHVLDLNFPIGTTFFFSSSAWPFWRQGPGAPD